MSDKAKRERKYMNSEIRRLNHWTILFVVGCIVGSPQVLARGQAAGELAVRQPMESADTSSVDDQPAPLKPNASPPPPKPKGKTVVLDQLVAAANSSIILQSDIQKFRKTVKLRA